MDFISGYVQLSVDGFYFNEITGKQSSSQIMLEAIADITDKNNVNANLITHLEYKRVLYLVKKENKNFNEAKKQAEKELLGCFLIQDKQITPEAVSITDNNTQANMLIAISSILLNAVAEEDPMEMDAKFTKLINDFRDEFEETGRIGEKMKETIKNASYRLNYKTVKENIENKYLEMGKNIAVGNFHYFIDGDGDGVLKEEDYEIDEMPGNELNPNEFFSKEEHFIIYTEELLKNLSDLTQKIYLFEALYTQSILYNDFSNYHLNEIFQHQIHTGNNFINDIFNESYKVIYGFNRIIQNGNYKEFQKYKYAGIVYRAYCYLNMIELWGDVPYMTNEPGQDVNFNPARTNKKEILSAIVTDLSESKDVLPDEGDNLICSKYLATALLANAYLQQKDYNNVLIQTSTIINSKQFALCGNYNDIFRPSNKETFFSFLTYENDDSVFNELVRKGPETPMIRYAEILLMAAEACLEQGRLADAVGYVNQVRIRNNRGLLTDNFSKNDIRSLILEEWENDLAKEGVWFFALKRFGLAESTLQIPSYMTLLPIPQREIDLNSNMTQNPGYH